MSFGHLVTVDEQGHGGRTPQTPAVGELGSDLMVAGWHGPAAPNHRPGHAEEVVAVGGHAIDQIEAPSTERPPWAMNTPDAAPSGISMSAVTEWEVFLVLITELSLRRPIPP